MEEAECTGVEDVVGAPSSMPPHPASRGRVLIPSPRAPRRAPPTTILPPAADGRRVGVDIDGAAAGGAGRALGCRAAGRCAPPIRPICRRFPTLPGPVSRAALHGLGRARAARAAGLPHTRLYHLGALPHGGGALPLTGILLYTGL